MKPTYHLILAALLCLAGPGCAKKSTTTLPPEAPIENRGSGLSPAEYNQVYNQNKNNLLAATNGKLDEAYQIGQRSDDVVLACVPSGNYNYRSGSVSVQHGFPSGKEAIDIGESFQYVIDYTDYVNEEFGVFNDYLAMVDAVPAERTAKELAMTQGLLVLYITQQFNHIFEGLRGPTMGRCSFEPVGEHLDLINNVRTELITAQLPTLLTDLENVGVNDMDLLRYQIQLDILSGRTAQASCQQVDERFEGHADEAMLLAWCGYDAYATGNDTQAREYWNRAKLVRGSATVSAYASQRVNEPPAK